MKQSSYLSKILSLTVVLALAFAVIFTVSAKTDMVTAVFSKNVDAAAAGMNPVAGLSKEKGLSSSNSSRISDEKEFEQLRPYYDRIRDAVRKTLEAEIAKINQELNQKVENKEITRQQADRIIQHLEKMKKFTDKKRNNGLKKDAVSLEEYTKIINKKLAEGKITREQADKFIKAKKALIEFNDRLKSILSDKSLSNQQKKDRINNLVEQKVKSGEIPKKYADLIKKRLENMK